MNTAIMESLIFWCGIGHVVLCLASLYIPKALNWQTHLSILPPLLKQMFWTYAGYILVVNFCFGVISIFGFDEMLNGSFLAKAISLFIGTYWLTRVLIQFLYFDRSQTPSGLIFSLAEIALVGLFIIFTLGYLAAFLINIGWI